MGAIKIPSADLLKKIYGETEESSARFTSLAENFEKKYHHDNAEFFTAPGRTEIIGNHVDHNGGQIIAASIDLDTIGAACPNGTNVIHMVSEGYKQEVVVDLDKLSTERYTKGTDALVAGIMNICRKKAMQQAVLMLMFPLRLLQQQVSALPHLLRCLFVPSPIISLMKENLSMVSTQEQDSTQRMYTGKKLPA